MKNLLNLLIKKIDESKNDLENHPQQKQVNILGVVIQCLRYAELMMRK